MTSNNAAKHIARLQEQNRLLAECLADERRLRKQAYAWYQKRLKSRWWSMLGMVVASVSQNDQGHGRRDHGSKTENG